MRRGYPRTFPATSSGELAERFREATQQYGLVAAAGTPRPIIEVLNKALRIALAADEVRKRLAADGAEPTPSTPEEHSALLEQELAKWSRLANEIGLKPE